MSRRSCYACGSLPSETRFPAERIRGLPVVCLDCALEWASEASRAQRCAEHAAAIRAGGIIRRAMWSARIRGAQQRRQRDWVREAEVGLL